MLSEALYARDTGDLLLAQEKADMLIALAPEDENIQAFLLSINELIEKKGLIVPNKLPEKAKNIEEHIHHSPSNQASVDDNNVTYEEIGNSHAGNADLINELLLLAYSQLSEGDLAAASSTLLEIEARDPNSKEAKLLSLKISAAMEKVQGLNLYKTRESMLNSVDNSWDQPKVFEIEDISKSEQVVVPSLVRKIENIVLPKINFTGMALTRVIETLSELSLEYDQEGEGVNIVPLFNSAEFNPQVNITLRNLSLDKILLYVTQQVNFTYEVGVDAITIQPSDSIGGSSTTITEFFPISRATVIRLTGFRDSSGPSNLDDPFAEAAVSSGPSQDQEKSCKSFPKCRSKF